jgi:hypothetical protein
MRNTYRGIWESTKEGEQPQKAQNTQKLGAALRYLVLLVPFVVSPEILPGRQECELAAQAVDEADEGE